MLNAMWALPFWEGRVVESCSEQADGSLLIQLSESRVVEDIDWLDRRSRITHRVRLWVEALSQLLPIAHVAQLTGLHWHTIKAIDHQRLERQHGEFASVDVRRLVMDEFALHKGHRYATVVMDA